MRKTWSVPNVPNGATYLRSLVAVAIATLALSALAHPLPLGFTSASSGWEASTDGINWIPAYQGYPNPISKPIVVDMMGNPTGENLQSAMMWYWNGPGAPNGSSGENLAYFRYQFNFSYEPFAYYGINIAADDWMQVKLNGKSVGEYLLTDHLSPANQPMVELLDIPGTDFIIGLNTIEIEAHDGGLVPNDYVYEWVFLDSVHNAPNYVPIVFVPEPNSLALAGFGIAAVGALRRRRPVSGQ